MRIWIAGFLFMAGCIQSTASVEDDAGPDGRLMDARVLDAGSLDASRDARSSDAARDDVGAPVDVGVILIDHGTGGGEGEDAGREEDLGAGGRGGEGGLGGQGGDEPEPTCESECARLTDCAVEICPGLTADNADVFEDGCVETCMDNLALLALTQSQAQCDGLVSTMQAVSPDFAEACDPAP
jgi:hypothetical protein